MRLRRTVTTALLGLALLATAPAAGAAGEIVADGGFEAAQATQVGSSTAVFSASWVEADTEYDSPLCDLDVCPTASTPHPHGPHTGTHWAWFGSGSTAGHTGSLTQTVTVPKGSARLSYWFRASFVEAPFDATLTVALDGKPVRVHTEPAVADSAYVQQDVDVSAFADGAAHTLSFTYVSPSTSGANLLLDDVSLTVATIACSVSSSEVTAAQQAVTGAIAKVKAAEKKLTKAKKGDKPAKVKKAKKKVKQAKAELAAAQSALTAAQAAFAAATAACNKA